MDVVYPFKEDIENNSEELRYSLRSLRNIAHDNVYIVGELPDWATGVIHIPVAQVGTKKINVSNNLRVIAATEAISENFLLMNDDFFIMRLLSTFPNLTFGTMSDVISDYEIRYPDGSDYIDSMKKLYDVLKLKGFQHPLSYELHIPMIINKYHMKCLFDDEASKRLYQFRTFYGNTYGQGGDAVKDVKVFLPHQHNDPYYNKNPLKYLMSQTFLSATGSAFKQADVGHFIRSSFEESSPYELS